MSQHVDLHADFAHLDVMPGELHLTARSGGVALVNLLAFGGAADRRTHVPAQVGALGDVVLWESTGAADALPFWNTNHAGDVYLLLVHGEVRIDFKQPETDVVHGYCLARTGDLVTLPRGVAHRTFSTSGRRRISLEIVPRNPGWQRLGEHADVQPSSSPALGEFSFATEGDEVVVSTPADAVRTPGHFFGRGVGALVAYELHLDHNEFEGGFVVHDHGTSATLKTPGHRETFPSRDVLALFKGLLERSP